MPRTVNVNYVTKEVKVLLHDSETESLAAATAIAAAAEAQEAKDVVVDNLQDSLDAIDAKTEEEKSELDGYTEEKKAEVSTVGQGYVDSASQKVVEANTILSAIRNEYGYPFTAATAADMTDTTKIYVYVGNETGYVNGSWYYHNGTAWVSGGAYNAQALQTDKTLTVSNAAADAQVTGVNLDNLFEFNPYDIFRNIHKNSHTHSGVTYTWHTDGSCTVNGTATALSFSRFFNNSNGFPKGMQKGKKYVILYNSPSANVKLQIFKVVGGNLTILLSETKNFTFTIPDDAEGLLIRLAVLAGATATNETVRPVCIDMEKFLASEHALVSLGAYPIVSGSTDDADTIKINSIVFVSDQGSGVSAIQNVPYAPGVLFTIGGATPIGDSSTSVVQQIMYPYNVRRNLMTRHRIQGVWSEWVNNTVMSGGVLPTGSDLNDILETNTYLLASGGNYINAPTDHAFFLQTFRIQGTNIVDYFQIAYEWFTGEKVYKRSKIGENDWTNWVSIGGGGGDTYNTTQNITQVSSSNTYNSTISPSITTDDNGWLQPVDTETESETGKTDMTPAIMAMLSSTGYCHLASGIFYVSGNIDMPEGSTLEGCGKNTIIRLLSSVSAGYCVRMGRYNTIKNITFSGGYNDFEPTTADIGGRNGVIFIANKDGTETTQPAVRPCMLTQCWFNNFNGSAIYAHNSGGGLTEAMIVSDCYLSYCEAGINLDYYTEYHKFTNMIVSHCYYACINNGGNNVFTGCTFHGTIGFLIDNSSGTKRNNAHGSVVGCTFNHIDNWNNPDVLGMGDAIKIIGSSTPGFIFTGCQIWYGAIVVNNAIGIAFSDCLIGGNTPKITIENNATAFFSNCMFRQRPNIINTALAKFDNCYLTSDGSVITGL